MRATSKVLMAALCLFVLSVRGADPPPNPQALPANILDVKEWWGSYIITVEGKHHTSRTRDNLTDTVDRTVSRRAEGSFHLNQVMNGGLMPWADPAHLNLDEMRQSRTWVSTFDLKNVPTADVTVDDSTESAGQLPVEAKMIDTTGGHATSSGHNKVKVPQPVSLIVNPVTKVYGLVLPFDVVNSSEVKVADREYTWMRTWDNQYTDQMRESKRSGPADKPDMPADKTHRPQWIRDQKLADDLKPGELKGSVSYQVPMGQESKTAYAHVTIEWRLSPKPPADLELVLSPANEETYENWRPEASLDPNVKGGMISFKAVLQKKGGGEPDETARQIMFRLKEVSHEPGICINYPLKDENADQADLQFRLEDNDWEIVNVLNEHTAVRAEKNPGQGVTLGYVNVSSFDFGAFGLLEAKAELQSGRVIYAHIKEDPDIYSLRIPKSRGDSHIADIWRKNHDAQGADDSDDDESPTGDGTKGDGFSLFEEYRGFMTQKHWSDMNPHVKDLFVIDRLDGRAKGGFDYFHLISKIDIHDIKPEESRPTKVINFNASAGRHSVDQHGLIVRMGTDKQFSAAVGGPGVPRQITAIEMCALYTGSIPPMDVAHEILHCCACWHHGEGDPGTQFWATLKDDNGDWKVYAVTVDSNGEPTGIANRKPIKLFSEKFPDIELYPPPRDLLDMTPCPVWVAFRHGQHSGDEDCIMRYHHAYAYPKGPPGEYFWIAHTETMPSKICDTISGHDYNAKSHSPRSRYDNADSISLRGDCIKQICVNDKGRPQNRDVHPGNFPDGYQP